MVLHELGHVFGVGHVANTIMDQSILFYLGAIDAHPHWSKAQKQEINLTNTLMPNHKLKVVEESAEHVSKTLSFETGHKMTLKVKAPNQEVLYNFVPVSIDFPEQNDPTSDMIFSAMKVLDESIKFTCIHFEKFSAWGFLEVDGTKYAAGYAKNMQFSNLKNMSAQSHKLDYFKDGVWNTIFVK